MPMFTALDEDKPRIMALADKLTDTYQNQDDSYRVGDVVLAFVNAMRHLIIINTDSVDEYDRQAVAMLGALTNCLTQGLEHYDAIKATLAPQTQSELKALN